MGTLELGGTWGALGDLSPATLKVHVALPPSLCMGRDLLHICRENPCPQVMELLEISSKEGGMIWIRRKWQVNCGFASHGDLDVGEKVGEEALQRGLELSEDTLGVQ